MLIPAFTIPEKESERKLVLVFGLHLPLDLINLFNIILLFNKSF